MNNENLVFGISTSLSGTDCYLDRLDELKSSGISEIEICLREDISETELLFDDAVEKINYSNLKVRSIHLPFGESVDPSELNESERLKNLEKIKRFIMLTKDCKASAYVIHASYEPIEENNIRLKRLESCIRSLTYLTELLGKYNIQLAVENLPRTCLGNSISEMADIIKSVPSLGVCFDFNHFTLPHPKYALLPLQRTLAPLRKKLNPVIGTPEAFAKKFCQQICAVHISDYDGINECHWIPGQGIVDFKAIHNILIKGGFNAPFMFEPNEICRRKRTTGKLLVDGYKKAISR